MLRGSLAAVLAAGALTAAAPSPPPVVVVERSGFSASADARTTEVDYGAVLRNVAADEDAWNVVVRTTVLDAAGETLVASSATVALVPAATPYYFGGRAYLRGRAAPARVEVEIEDAERLAAADFLPPVSGVRMGRGTYGAEIAGQVSNPYLRRLSRYARITGVVFDAQGNVIGGGSTTPVASVVGRMRLGFRIFTWAVEQKRAARAAASVELLLDR